MEYSFRTKLVGPFYLVVDLHHLGFGFFGYYDPGDDTLSAEFDFFIFTIGCNIKFSDESNDGPGDDTPCFV